MLFRRKKLRPADKKRKAASLSADIPEEHPQISPLADIPKEHLEIKPPANVPAASQETNPPADVSRERPVLPGLWVTSISLLGGRKSQQDVLDYRVLPEGRFAAVVCDGMGGLNGGAQAAAAACEGFFEVCEDALSAMDREMDLIQIARDLDRRVTLLTDEDGLPLDGGCTLVAAVFQEWFCQWLSVGDSRIGLLRNGQIFWKNRLHNYRLELDEARRLGELSQAEYEAELPKGPALLSYLGCGGLRYIDCQSEQLEPGDYLLLCSDGFYDLLPEEELVSVLQGLNEEMTNLPQLLAPFLEETRKGMDNASAVVIHYTGGS